MVYLDVPYSEKDNAKQLGAKWNPELKKWFIPTGLDITAFIKWVPKEIKPNLYAIGELYLVSALNTCQKCGEVVIVYCLASERFEMIEKTEDFEDEDSFDTFTTYSQLKQLPAELESFFKAKFPTYFNDYSNTIKSNYYMNHCSKCGVKSGDFFLHNKLGGAFFPEEEEQARNITLVEIPLPEAKVPLTATSNHPDYISEFAKRL